MINSVCIGGDFRGVEGLWRGDLKEWPSSSFTFRSEGFISGVVCLRYGTPFIGFHACLRTVDGARDGGCWRRWGVISVNPSSCSEPAMPFRSGGLHNLYQRFSPLNGALMSYLKRVVLKSGFSENRELGLLEVFEKSTEMPEEESIDIKFRLYDGSDIGPFRYSAASTVDFLKQRVVSDWPKGKTVVPKGINEVKLISSGKILENNKTVAQCKTPFGETAGGVTVMHVVVQPSPAKTKSGQSVLSLEIVVGLELPTDKKCTSEQVSQ
ncbi:hypothetical protein HID58_001468 [Brassica napus]|uniref:Ubiquitin-like domain-containing protein n=1 Tax=Brassica napus TaxID=3708 RepID=A0ABQ8EJQ8_BRANA|nr:hypothetical protein HID58_001468 [Brassica napus]